MVEEKPKVEIRRPKTKKGRAALKSREPKLVEDVKKALLLHGHKTSQVVKDVLSDFGKLKWDECVKFSRIHDNAKPFETAGEVILENYAKKLDCGLFVVGNHTKKRPHNLVMGRTFDAHIYDMVELGVENYKGIKDFRHPGSHLGGKPCFVFVGEKFETVAELKQVKSMLLDFFRGRVVSNVNSRGLDRVIFVLAMSEKRVLFRHYKVTLKKSGDPKEPNVELLEMGPHIDFTVRRCQEASEDLAKEAHRQPPKKKKEKGVMMDNMSNKVGRIYIGKQDVDSIVMAKTKGLKRERRQAAKERKESKKLKQS